MKKTIAICAAILMTASVFLPQHASAQAPNKMSYQAVIRNSSNVLVTNTSVGMRISILQTSPSGSAVYVETQTPTSNANGLVSIEIGGGTVVSGTFSSIDWANGPYFIQTETDPAGGTNYSITGTSQLLSVPFALYAQNGLNNGAAAGNTPYWDGTKWVTNSSNVWNNGGYVGVATNAPTAQLDIAGTLRVRGGNPGVGKTLTSDVDGLAKWQNNIAFQATSSSSGNILTATTVKMNYLLAPLNDGNAYNLATDEFTAPVKGVYSFQYGEYLGGVGANGNAYIELHKNGIYIDGSTIEGTDFTTRKTLSGSITVPLNAGDVVTVQIRNNTGATTTTYSSNGGSHFSGFLLYERP